MRSGEVVVCVDIRAVRSRKRPQRVDCDPRVGRIGMLGRAAKNSMADAAKLASSNARRVIVAISTTPRPPESRHAVVAAMASDRSSESMAASTIRGDVHVARAAGSSDAIASSTPSGANSAIASPVSAAPNASLTKIRAASRSPMSKAIVAKRAAARSRQRESL